MNEYHLIYIVCFTNQGTDMILRSLAYGYLGSAAAGLAVAALGVTMDMTEQTVVAIATPAGMVCGLAGLAYAWRGRVMTLMQGATLRRRP